MPAPSRSLPLSGASNFRDLGGYTGAGGRSVRWRRLFRSDHLAGLTAQDLQLLADLGVARVCDFRGVFERVPQPCAIPGARVFSLAIEPTVVQGMEAILASGEPLTPQATVALMEAAYRDFVQTNTLRYGELFGHLLDGDTPLVFHCTAGKDRTGLAAALILSALGVPRAVVMQDYLLTNSLYRRAASTSDIASPDVMDVLWRVQEQFLEAALQVIEAEYGDVQNYLRKALALGVREQTRLEELYLAR